eukprot:9678265-Alexandrium_andersonii.AAC.1
MQESVSMWDASRQRGAPPWVKIPVQHSAGVSEHKPRRAAVEASAGGAWVRALRHVACQPDLHELQSMPSSEVPHADARAEAHVKVPALGAQEQGEAGEGPEQERGTAEEPGGGGRADPPQVQALRSPPALLGSRQAAPQAVRGAGDGHRRARPGGQRGQGPQEESRS